MPIEFNLPNKTAGESAEFSQRFNALPNELQDMIIAETVRFPEPVPLHRFRRVLGFDTLRFAEDGILLEEARKQFFKVNRFLQRVHKPLELGHTASRIRHLNLTLTISVHGGDVFEKSTYMLPPHIADYIMAIPRVFRFLERLQLTVDNAGWFDAAAKYTSRAHPWMSELPEDLSEVYSNDRMTKMSHVLGLLRNLEFPRWTRDLVVKKRVFFKQALLGDSQVMLTMPDPDPLTDKSD